MDRKMPQLRTGMSAFDKLFINAIADKVVQYEVARLKQQIAALNSELVQWRDPNTHFVTCEGCMERCLVARMRPLPCEHADCPYGGYKCPLTLTRCPGCREKERQG